MPDLERFTPRPDPRPTDDPWPGMIWPPATDRALAGRWLTLTQADPDADVPAVAAAIDDARVWAHLPLPPGAASVRYLLTSASNRLPWVVRLAAPLAGLPAGAVVGTTTLLDVSPLDARAEIGATAYAPAVWGSAVNPEAKLLLLGFAFEELHAGRVQIKTDVRNVRSQQAIARLGASYEGVLRRYQRRADGTLRDTVLFSVTAEEWPAVRSRLTERLDALEP